jgi:hypothetical protein
MNPKRYALLVAGIMAFAVMALFAATPIAWINAGKPNESYAELVYVGLGLPAALIAIIAGALQAKFLPSRPRVALIPLKATASFAILVCGWLIVVGLGPNNPGFDAFVGPSLSPLFSFGLPVLVVALMVSVRIAVKPTSTAKNA